MNNNFALGFSIVSLILVILMALATCGVHL